MPPEAEVTQTAAPEIKPDAGTPAPDASTQTAAPDKAAGEGEPTPPKSALEAAQRVMVKEAKPAAAPQQTETDKPATDAAKPDGKDVAAEDDSNLPFKEHPKWKLMSSENRTLKVAKTKNEEAIKALEPKAKTLDELTVYLRDNNLAKDDFQQALTIMAAIRNDPEAAYKQLRGVMDKLELVVGVRLPEDLETRVAAGALDQEAARELAQSRSRAALAQSRAETLEQRRAQDEEARTQSESEGQLKSVVDSLNSWDSEWVKRDPDAQKMRPFVADLLLVRGQEKPPRNAQEARELAEACVVEARKRLTGFIPAPRPKEGALPAGGAHIETAAVPKSSLDAARAALAR